MTLRRFTDARYSGQVYEIETPVPSVETLMQAHLDGLVASYEDAHDALNHYRVEGYPAEFVACQVEAVGRVEAVTPEELPAAGRDPSAAAKESRLAYLPDEGRFEPVETFDGERLEPGNRIAGTVIVETGARPWSSGRISGLRSTATATSRSTLACSGTGDWPDRVQRDLRRCP